MYTITEPIEKEVKGWIAKLPDSMVKSQITTLFDGVFPSKRMTVEQLEKFLSYQNALPKEFQTYPQTFAQLLKNQGSDTISTLSDSHSHVKSDKPAAAAAKEDAQIIARNKNVPDAPKEKVKPQVIVVKKK